MQGNKFPLRAYLQGNYPLLKVLLDHVKNSKTNTIMNAWKNDPKTYDMQLTFLKTSREYILIKKICDLICDAIRDDAFWKDQTIRGNLPSRIKKMGKFLLTYNEESDPLKTIKNIAAIIGKIEESDKNKNTFFKFYYKIIELSKKLNFYDTESIALSHMSTLEFLRDIKPAWVSPISAPVNESKTAP